MQLGIAPTVRFVAIVWLGLLACLATMASAQTTAEDATNIRASLVADGPAVAGETFTLAIRFQPVSDEWHGYWRNPGDAGYGMELDWDLPDGWTAGEPLYPVPQRLVIGGLMNHVYAGEYAVLVPIAVPREMAVPRAAKIGLKAQWLACTDTICVPEQARLTASLRARPSRSDADRFRQWQAAIPPKLDSAAQYRIDAKSLRIAVPLPAAVGLTAPHVYVANRDLVRYSSSQNFFRKGDMLIVEIKLADPHIDPGAVDGILAFANGRGVEFSAVAGPVPADGIRVNVGDAEGPNLALLFLAALAGGLILNIMPCVFPILSLKALSFARAGADGGEARRESVAYTVGVILTCVALGGLMLTLRAGGEQIGWAFQLQEPWVVIALFVLAAIIAANLAGWFELPSIAVTRRGEPASAFATGLLAAVAATPCSGPFMAAALGAALLLPVVPALLLFAALGLGLALPFLLIGWVPALRRMLPKPGAWMERFRRILAIPMALTALALVWLTSRLGGQGFALIALATVAGVVAALFVVGRLQRSGKMAWPAFSLIAAPFVIFAAIALPATYDARAADGGSSILAPQSYSAQALREARASGQPVFLWFTADWCVTCKVNEEVAIEREATRTAFEKAGVIPIRGDWTQRDAAITEYLTEQGVAGIPLYVWYGQDGRTTVLPQVLTPDALVILAQQDRTASDIRQ